VQGKVKKGAKIWVMPSILIVEDDDNIIEVVNVLFMRIGLKSGQPKMAGRLWR